MELPVVNHEDYFAKIGDDNKFMLLNIFDNLIQENANLKREIATLDIPENTN